MQALAGAAGSYYVPAAAAAVAFNVAKFRFICIFFAVSLWRAHRICVLYGETSNKCVYDGGWLFC